MSFRSFALLPFAITFVLLRIHTVVTPWNDWGRGLDIVSLAAKVAALIGGILAARSFDRGDYMRRAFTFEAAMFGFFVVRDCCALIPPIRAALETAHIYDALWRFLFVAANVAGLFGASMMARAATLAVFDDDGAVWRGRLWLLLALLVGIVLTGPAIVVSATEIGNGQLHSFVVFIGSIADLASFVLAVPVIRLAYALRGGLLYIPWTLLAMARLWWLVRDCFGAAPQSLWQMQAFLIAAEAARTLACTNDFAAGLAFRQIFSASTAMNEDEITGPNR